MPSSFPAVSASSQGTPSNHAKGIMIQPSMRSNVRLAPAISGKRPRIILIRLTNAIMTTNMAMTLINSAMPSVVPFVTASMVLAYRLGTSKGCSVVSSPLPPRSPGTMSRATIIAAGALIRDAVRICPSALSTATSRTLA